MDFQGHFTETGELEPNCFQIPAWGHSSEVRKRSILRFLPVRSVRRFLNRRSKYLHESVFSLIFEDTGGKDEPMYR